MKVNTDVNGKPLPCELYLDGYFNKTLSSLNQYIKTNWDVVGLFTGEEGAGKTTLAMQAALFMDANFSNKNIVFNSDQFERIIDELPFGSVILWDEADDVGSAWASNIMFTLKKTFKRIRKRNFIIFLVTPTFHDLNKYFAIARTRFLVDVYADKFTRGRFKVFDKKGKKLLYIKGKSEMDMECVRPFYRASFTNYPKNFPIDMEAYEIAKDEATMVAIDQAVGSKDVRLNIHENLTKWFSSHDVKVIRQDYAFILGVDKRTISRYRSQSGLKG